MFTEERRKDILAQLNIKSNLLVNELSDRYNVSAATIRKDLSFLEQEGFLKRTHGGAVSMRTASFEQTPLQRASLNYESKVAIAKKGAELVDDNDTIALDAGTTTLCMVQYLLNKRNLTIITPDIKIAEGLENSRDATVILTGGTLRRGYDCTVGVLTNEILSRFHVDKVFMATNAISPDGRLSTPNTEQASVKSTLIKMATKRILLCDKSKFNSVSLCDFGCVNDFNIIITDDMPVDSSGKFLQKHKNKIITV